MTDTKHCRSNVVHRLTNYRKLKYLAMLIKVYTPKICILFSNHPEGNWVSSQTKFPNFNNVDSTVDDILFIDTKWPRCGPCFLKK